VSTDLLLVLALLLLISGAFAAVRGRAVLAAVALPLGLLGVLGWVLERSGTVNL